MLGARLAANLVTGGDGPEILHWREFVALGGRSSRAR